MRSSSISVDRSNLADRRGFTIPEVLVVAGVIALLIAVLLPALNSAMRTGDMAKAQSNLRQIAIFMTNYSSDNREYILPSQFDYTAIASPPQSYPVKVRSHPSLGPDQWKGSWADILWTTYDLGKSAPDWGDAGEENKYLTDSPDLLFLDRFDSYESPFRSPAPNSRDFINSTDGKPKPLGSGAREASYPGFFAANNFFNVAASVPGLPLPRWFTTGQIKAPDRSVYLVDSHAGETIDPLTIPSDPWDATTDTSPADGVPDTFEGDFRYNGVCLMMYLDGHSSPEAPWENLDDLEDNRKIKVRDLDKN